MKIKLEIDIDCENPNEAPMRLEILNGLLEDFVTESHVLIHVTDSEEWQLFINFYNITIKEIEYEL